MRTLPKQPWAQTLSAAAKANIVDAHGTVIARTFCDSATGHKTYNEQIAQAENLAHLITKSPAILEALKLTVESLDQLLPYMDKVPADIGLLNSALCAARPLLTHFEKLEESP
jgi:maleate cis-trans isomerase